MSKTTILAVINEASDNPMEMPLANDPNWDVNSDTPISLLVVSGYYNLVQKETYRSKKKTHIVYFLESVED